MEYVENEIKKLKSELKKYQDRKIKFKKVLATLKVGDEIYEEQPRFIDYDYHPQIIKKIDKKNLKVLTYEKSIKVEKWRNNFHLFNEKTQKFEYHG